MDTRYLTRLTGGPPQEYSDNLTWKPLRFLTFYRLILAGFLATIYFIAGSTGTLGAQNPHLFGIGVAIYVVFALGAGFAARLRRPSYRWQTMGQVLTDIVVITLLMHTSGGIESGLGILLLVAVAAGSLLVPGRMALLFAAIATLAVLSEYGFAYLTADDIPAGGVTRAGLLGAAFFATAVLARMLATQLRESKALAEQRGVDLANLEELNERIIQRLQSGIVVVDAQGTIRLMNRTAARQLHMEQENAGQPIAQVLPELHAHLRTWCSNPEWAPPPIQLRESETRLIPKFTRLGTADGVGAIISLEDSSALAQQAQQMKLASLGRLTASIAHEIRNPLGAISHAAQLLAESDNMDSGDQRLTEIIRNHTQRMNSIIENVLQLSRRQPSDAQDINLGPWLSHFIAEFCATLNTDSNGVDLSLPNEDIHVLFDPNQLHQVLWNLLQNGLEHGGNHDTPAHLEVRLDFDDKRRAPHLEIIDNGPGIPPERREQIFEPFFTTATTGTGLGLYIARELCESNQATLRYHDTPEGGSCFRIELARPMESVSTHRERQ